MRAADTTDFVVRLARKFVRLIDEAVDLTVLVCLLFLLSCGCYSIWDSKQVYRGASAVEYEIYKPDLTNDLSFEELRRINEDVFGWITVYGTAIDYPVLQGEDNWEYLNTNCEGEYSLTGSIFLDYKNSKSFDDYNSIIHGHHMAASAMFGDLDKFDDLEFFNEHKYGSLYYDGKEHGLTFFGYTVADAYDSDLYRILDSESGAKEEYLTSLMDKLMHSRDCGQVDAEHLVLLSTCSSEMTNGRSVLAGFITDEVQDDPFYVEQTDEPRVVRGLDPILRMTEGQPLWVWLLILLIVLILVYVVSDIISKNIRTKKAIRNKSCKKEGNTNEEH